jgi:hypothetical protein
MRGPKIEWLQPGEDPTTAPYEAPRRHLRSCLTPILLAVAFFGIVGVFVARNKSNAAPLHTATVTPSVTPGVTLIAVTVTDDAPRPMPSPTDSPEPSPTMILPTMTLAPTIEGMTIYAAQIGDSGIGGVSCELYQGKDRQRCQREVAKFHAQLTKVPKVKPDDSPTATLSVPTALPETEDPTVAPDLEQPIQPTADQR